MKLCVESCIEQSSKSPIPKNVREVLEQPTNYGKNSSYFENQPSELCVKLALRLLEGERLMHRPSFFRQINVQGSGVLLSTATAILQYKFLLQQ
jgi:hypothetical protein